MRYLRFLIKCSAGALARVQSPFKLSNPIQTLIPNLNSGLQACSQTPKLSSLSLSHLAKGVEFDSHVGSACGAAGWWSGMPMVARNQLMLITGAAKGMTFQLDKKIESQVIWLMQICTLHPVRCAKHDDPGTPDSPSQSLTKKP